MVVSNQAQSSGTVQNALPPIRRILNEDYPQEVGVENNNVSTTWFQKPQSIINNFMYYMYNLMNGGLKFDSNIATQTETLTFSTPKNYVESQNFTSITFNKTLTTKAKGVFIVQIINTTNSNFTPIYGAVGCPSWLDNGNSTITISYISGLADSSDYQITFVVF